MCLAQGPQRSEAGEISGLYFPSRLIFFTIEKDGTRCIPKVIYVLFFFHADIAVFRNKTKPCFIICHGAVSNV